MQPRDTVRLEPLCEFRMRYGGTVAEGWPSPMTTSDRSSRGHQSRVRSYRRPRTAARSGRRRFVDIIERSNHWNRAFSNLRVLCVVIVGIYIRVHVALRGDFGVIRPVGDDLRFGSSQHSDRNPFFGPPTETTPWSAEMLRQRV